MAILRAVRPYVIFCPSAFLSTWGDKVTIGTKAWSEDNGSPPRKIYADHSVKKKKKRHKNIFLQKVLFTPNMCKSTFTKINK